MEVVSSPVPNGRYVIAKRHKDVIYTSGMTPRRSGVLVYTGAVKPGCPVEDYRDAAVMATANAVKAALQLLEAGERICEVLVLTVFVAAEPEFTDHPRIADFASTYLYERFGANGVGARAAVGVNSLPGNATIEIQLSVVVDHVPKFHPA
ncbi:RidA family protein [Pelagibacterium lacus]|uniref:RidA family protein n=1 Tax=Pelagibacterium lacus TaxID=2282655 RepID=A0A369W4R9_9HYPH|nr:RidA family protein [Pelagibacterium lacus]RDE08865.1 RidA family protein [Pelagibacterium lacus]